MPITVPDAILAKFPDMTLRELSELRGSGRQGLVKAADWPTVDALVLNAVENGPLAIGDIAEATEINRTPLEASLRRLLDAGLISRIGVARATRYGRVR